MTTRGWLVAAPRSGGGKTTVTLALVAALRRRGVRVRTAKSGPDYIDPAFHAAASGAPGVNLDSWAMPPPLLDRLFTQAAEGAELLVVESAMGLFDGVAGPTGRTGNAADLAARYGLPVLLVLDVTGQAQTAAAVAQGIARFDPAVRVGGVILNRVGSDKHRRSVEAAMRLPVLGVVPRDAGLALPERHLGLVQAAEHPALAAQLERLADMAERCLDLDALLDVSPFPAMPGQPGNTNLLSPPGQRIAIASDAAFSFTYPHLLRAWREAGAELLRFSPLANEPPPDSADICWLPGGYPELHAPALAVADRFHAELRRFAETRPVHGECGGHMVLGAALTAADGSTHPMTGLLGHITSFAQRGLHLGYRRATLPDGTVLRGHEFHYATVTQPGDDAPYATVEDAAGASLGPTGGRRGYVTGSFFHAIARETA
ncbi:cobyrinate a,c-diamide synthase [Acidisphaera sp. L21]|uniref:cobyrinate a,c-diamide synthase n=1 Tax=Acidisphaera sp. L21 TaxID=1641851 RepID=UPI00131DACFC|nr:cobyrinate a,c-diamide synthase [Acidisphaera sp. L21]